MLALDTETTGADHYHGTRPFLVTVCDGHMENTFWEWAVDPLSRMPIIPPADISHLTNLLRDPKQEFVLHNSRFDYTALGTILPLSQEEIVALWDRTEDTLTAAHVLGSALPHGLDACALQYLRYKDMNSYEDRVEHAVKKARDYCRRHLPDWRLAREGDPMMPSVSGGKESKNTQDKDKPWKSDMWLLKALLNHPHPADQQEHIEGFRKLWAGEDGDGLVADYANLDTSVTRRLWPVMKAELKRRDLWHHYKERMKLLPIAYRLEQNALTLSESRMNAAAAKFSKGVSESSETCLRIAEGKGFPLTLPKGSANNRSLKVFCFGEASVKCDNCNKQIVVDRATARTYRGKVGVCTSCRMRTTATVREWEWLDLPVLKRTDSGEPSLDKDTMSQYLGAEELTDQQRDFLTALVTIRKAGKALEAVEQYRRFWLPIAELNAETEDWYLIHPNLNPTGTDTLRWSCKNPNLQNPSKDDDYGVREPFGPAPGREHWSLDYRNIEKRIPAYKCGQQEFIDLFERADEPPYYGSDHILKFSAVYPHLWEQALREHGENHAAEWIKSKEGYKATYYQWIKNTNFALQYECGDAKADMTAHAKGVKKLLSGAFPQEAEMKRWYIQFASRHGYVETMPDRTVNPNRGYPLMTKRTERGDALPTVPLAYFVSGTAMWLTARAMVECQKQLDVWNRECGIPNHYRMALQVHDELIFDFPKAANPKLNPRRSNLARARIIQRIMEGCGSDLICKRLDGKVVTVPTPVSVEYHPVSWEKGVAV